MLNRRQVVSHENELKINCDRGAPLQDIEDNSSELDIQVN